jgi:hypothetical protein
MKLLTKPQPTPPEPPALSLTEATRQHAEADAEVRRLEQLVTGVVTTTTTRQVPVRYLTPMGPHGTVEEGVAETEHREDREVGFVEQLRARAALPGARLRAEELRLAVEEAKITHAATRAASQAQALVDGRNLVLAELPDLLAEQRALQRKWQAFRARLEAVDHRAGGPHFAGASWAAMAVGGSFDGFAAYVIDGFRLDA